MTSPLISLRRFVTRELTAICNWLDLDPPDIVASLPDEPGDGPTYADLIAIDGYTLTLVPGGIRLSLNAVVAPGHEPLIEVPGGVGTVIGLRTLGRLEVVLGADPHLRLLGPALFLRLPATLLSAPPEGDDDTLRQPAEMTVSNIGELIVDEGFNLTLRALPGGTLDVVAENAPWRIGESGMELTLDGLSLSLDGRLEEFQVGADRVVLTLPPQTEGEAPASFRLEQARFDRNGFSGELSADLAAEWEAATHSFRGDGAATVAGLPVGLHGVEIVFADSRPTRFALNGATVLPFFDPDPVAVSLSLDDGGGLRFALTPTEGALRLQREGVGRFDLRAFDVRVADALATLTLAGDLWPDLPERLALPDLRVSIDDLVIDSTGAVRLGGGGVDFTPELSFGLAGFRGVLSRIGIAQDEDLRFSFDGGLVIGERLAAVRLLGLGIVIDGDDLAAGGPAVPRFELEGIELEAKVAGAYHLRGRARFIDDDTATGFAGDIMISLETLQLVLQGSVLAVVADVEGERFPALFTSVGVDLPGGIPIGPTGLVLSGLHGLLGINVAPRYDPAVDGPWYEGWYKRPPLGVTSSAKWQPRKGGFALGAGVTIGTADGFTASTRDLLAVAFPGPIVLIEGRAVFLQSRTALSDEAPLRALILIEPESLRIVIEAEYEFVPGIFVAAGLIDLFTELRANPDWHFHLGRDLPADKRIRAEILNGLLQASAYFMIDDEGTRIGALAELKIGPAGFGPIRAGAEASAAFTTAVSYAPPQVLTALALRGRLYATICGFGFDFRLAIESASQAPRPFLLEVNAELTLALPWPLEDASLSFRMLWSEPVPPAFPDILDGIQLAAPMRQEPRPVESHLTAVALDARPQIGFSHAVEPPAGAALSGLLGRSDFVHQVGDHEFRYRLTGLSLTRADGSALDLYGTFQAMPPMGDSDMGHRLVLLGRGALDWSAWADGDAAVGESLAGNPVDRETGPEEAKTWCIRFGTGKPRLQPADWIRDGLRLRTLGPALAFELPPQRDLERPLRPGLNILPPGWLEQGGQGWMETVDGPPEEAWTPDPRLLLSGRLGEVVLELSWPRPVEVVELKAGARRILAEVEGRLEMFRAGGRQRVTRLLLAGPFVHLARICVRDWAEVRAAARNAVNARVFGQLAEVLRRDMPWQAESFVFEPHTGYRLSVTLEKQRTPDSAVEQETRTVTFETGGTPERLDPYLRPPSAPDAADGPSAMPPAPDGFRFVDGDGRMLPFYRRDEIGLFFGVDYVRQMFEERAGETLEIELLSPDGQPVAGRVARWRKAADRADRQHLDAYLAALSDAGATAATPADLPTDDVLTAEPLPEQGGLAAGAVHEVRIVTRRAGRAESDVLFSASLLASRYDHWDDLFSAMNGDLPRLSAAEFDGLDPDLVDSLDSLAAAAIVAAPRPADPLGYLIENAAGEPVLLVLEMPERVAEERFAIHWQDASGVLLDLGPAMIRADETIWAWRSDDVDEVAAMVVRHRRAPAFQGESAPVEEERLYAVRIVSGGG